MAKSQIDEATVKRIAHLARLRISSQEAQSLQRELNGILAFVEELNAIPTDGVEPLTHTGATQLRMRTDVVNDGGRGRNRQERAQVRRRLLPRSQGYRIVHVIE